jgi:cytoplasmic tRNA 2-thiolation protein 2
MTAATAADPCVDCQERDASLTVRNRRLCAACFIRYVQSKILKRMESYRFKNLAGDQKRRLFLPISGGVSSLVLLQVLDAQLQKQLSNRNKTAYHLVVARVVLPHSQNVTAIEAEYQILARRFPLHSFLPIVPLHDVFGYDGRVREDLERLGNQLQPGVSDKDSLRRALSAATSVTTRADLEAILLQRLLVAIAKQQDCESVLWGHSDSRLAALALADIAKGRGGSVSSNIADGPSFHDINFNFPARELFKSELQTYAQALDEPLPFEADPDAAGQPVSSIRNTSIDSLLTSYIASQGEKYPSIMANVVRTASKLHVKDPNSEIQPCSFCVMPAIEVSNGQGGTPGLCYGCRRMKQDIRL